MVGTAGGARANAPLTDAEQQVCRTLNHCLKIVDDHPMDSYDYAVLTEEFRRYGSKGRDALIRRLRKGGPKAGHAADLLALSRDASALPPLKALKTHKDESVRTLAHRTYEALEKRLGKADPALPESMTRPAIPVSLPCPTSKPVSLASQQREMPFFEVDVAQPDRFGAYRPSAPYRIASPRTLRSDLTSAVSVPGGWLAGYSGGLIRYDNDTGEPDVMGDTSVLSLQRKKPTDLTSGVWAIMDAPEGVILSDALTGRTVIRLSGQLRGLGRTKEDHLIVSTTTGAIVRLSAEGELMTGCGDTA